MYYSKKQYSTRKHRIPEDTINKIKEMAMEKSTYGYRRIWTIIETLCGGGY